MSKPLSCLLLLLHFLSPWVTVLLCVCDIQKCHGRADNSTSLSELERGKKRGSPVHVLVTEPLGSFREDVRCLLLIPADRPPSSEWTQHFSERQAPLHLDTHLKVYELSWLLFTYTSAIRSTSKPLLWNMLGYPRHEKYSTNPFPMLIQT